MREFSLATETARLQCLQALGITVYHPRMCLPGAAPSRAWPVIEEESARVQEASVSTPARKEAPAAAPANASVSPQAPKSTPAVRAERAVEMPGASVGPFQLLFLQIDDDLAVLNQIPALARTQLQDKQRALLGNLLHWLGKSLPAQGPRVFRWPLPGLESLAGGMQPTSNVQQFLEQASAERGFRLLLMLGPQAAVPQAPDWQGIATHSLDEMLALPALKREVWQALLPLRAQLCRNPV
jgi:hypothetical protein